MITPPSRQALEAGASSGWRRPARARSASTSRTQRSGRWKTRWHAADWCRQAAEREEGRPSLLLGRVHADGKVAIARGRQVTATGATESNDCREGAEQPSREYFLLSRRHHF